MSFSKEVKDELVKTQKTAKHCQMAELAAMLSFGVTILKAGDTYQLYFSTEYADIAKKCFTLLKNAFHVSAKFVQANDYTILVQKQEDVLEVLRGLKWLDENDTLEEHYINKTVNTLLIQKECCQRAYVRGCFLMAGSLTDPNKAYHFEIVCISRKQAVQLIDILQRWNMDGKIVARKKHYIVYIKEGSQIVDMLNIIEAHVSLIKFENIRILKEMRNSINRQVNCEAANINKTVSAAVKQVECIKYIQETVGLAYLPEALQEMAEVRLKYPETPLKDLGEVFESPLTKSGVNHRLRKICEIARELQEERK